jgi:hypothetical protein
MIPKATSLDESPITDAFGTVRTIPLSECRLDAMTVRSGDACDILAQASVAWFAIDCKESVVTKRRKEQRVRAKCRPPHKPLWPARKESFSSFLGLRDVPSRCSARVTANCRPNPSAAANLTNAPAC